VPDPTDGRARLIRLTDRGKDVERTARQIIRNIEAEWSDRLGDERMAQLRETLRDLAAMLER
jgi:DNA-binding MarR family transcriptional regulator